MMLIEETEVPASALPVGRLTEHLRLGTGFADDALQNGLLEGCLRAAIATIETRIGKVLLSRDFSLTLRSWHDPAGLALPVAPVSGISAVAITGADGVVATVAPGQYRLRQDRHRPRMEAVGGLPGVPDGGQVGIRFTAGFGVHWSSVPADLAQAVLLLAAQFYENRHDTGSQNPALPAAVQALLSPWRNVRVLRGGEA